MKSTSMKSVLIIGFLILTMGSVSPGWTDVIRLANGDRLNGTLQILTDKQATFETFYAGTIKIPRDQINTIATDEPVTLIYYEDTYLTARLYHHSDTQMKLKTTSQPVETSSTFSLTDIDEIHRKDPRERLREKLKVKLSGQTNLSLEFLRGNTDEESYHFDGEMQARTPSNRYTVRAEFNKEKSNGRATEENALGFVKYDHFVSDRWFLFNSATFSKDDFEDLELRTALGAGVGYQFYEEEDLTLFLEGGASYVNDNFEVAPDQSGFGARYSIDYRQTMVEWVRIFHFQEGLGGPEIDFVFRSRTGLRIPLGQGFQMTAQYDLDWDADPEPGVSSTDTRYLLNLGYKF